MDDQKARHVSHFGGMWPGQNLGPFREELPKPTEWDQLLAKLGLNDPQALDAVKSDGEDGEQLRNFVLRVFGQCFVPEAVIEAVRRCRKENQLAISLATQPTAINSNTVAKTSQSYLSRGVSETETKARSRTCSDSYGVQSASHRATRSVRPERLAMAHPSKIQFMHRRNADGTIDSICSQCCTTVAIDNLESKLSEREREHICDLELTEIPHYRLSRVS